MIKILSLQEIIWIMQIISLSFINLIYLRNRNYIIEHPMKEQFPKFRFTHEQITSILNNLLKIPKRTKTQLLHPSEQRSHYSVILNWLTTSTSNLLKLKDEPIKKLCQKQQQIIVSCLQQLIVTTRKQCIEKSLILQMILEYVVVMLNSYWTVFQSANRQIIYQYQHNSVKVESQYIADIKDLQIENEQLRRDKEHRWRNMYMLIKDNRIHRKQNKKLIKKVDYQLEKNANFIDQMIKIREQNQKLKIKLLVFEEDPIRLESYVQTELKLIELEKKVKDYPKRCKRALKNDLFKIQIKQINNLNDKIDFIIKAIEQTGEIIDQIYDEDVAWNNFQYNISTQTDITLEDKGVNTNKIRCSNAQTHVDISELVQLDFEETVSVKLKGFKMERKQLNRDSKNVMFLSTSNINKFTYAKKDMSRSRKPSKRSELSQNFTFCQSIKITIYKGRISYISTYNTEVFNGLEMIKKIEKQIQSDSKSKNEVTEKQVQTQPNEDQFTFSNKNSKYPSKKALPYNSNIIDSRVQLKQMMKKKAYIRPIQLAIFEQVYMCYDPSRHRILPTRLKQSLNSEKDSIVFKPVMAEVSQQPLKNSILRNNNSLGLGVEKPFDSDRAPIKSPLNDIRTSFVRKINYYQKQNAIQQQKEEGELSQQHVQDSLPSKVVLKGSSFASEQKTKDASKHNSIFSPTLTKHPRNSGVSKQFNKSMDSFISLKSKHSRNISEIIPQSQLKNRQPKKVSKLIDTKELLKNKRAVTQQAYLDTIKSETSSKNQNRHLKIKPLNRISQDYNEMQILNEDMTKVLLYSSSLSRNLESKDIDFLKSFQRILLNIDLRRNELITSSYTLKRYLASYFKCHYGKEIYPNFVNFLSTSEPQQITSCFSRLINPNMTQAYLVDLFKSFIFAINKCYLVNEFPAAEKVRLQILKYFASIFFENDDVNRFTSKMIRFGCESLIGWFNCLEQQLRAKAIESQLQSFLLMIVTESEDSISYQFLEQLCYFIQNDQEVYKLLINIKFMLGPKPLIHRFSLFCLRYKWTRMLDIETSIEFEYCKRIGPFNEPESFKRIDQNFVILKEFKNLDRCYKYWRFHKRRYGIDIDHRFTMLIQLNILQYRLKNELPISKNLKFMNLAFEGLQKRSYFNEVKNKIQSQSQKKENIL